MSERAEYEQLSTLVTLLGKLLYCTSEVKSLTNCVPMLCCFASHAIETGLGYGAWLHGEAVSTGMVMAAELSLRMGLVDTEIVTRTTEVLRRAGLPVSLENSHAEAQLGSDEYKKRILALTKSRFLQLMSVDKKVSDGRLSLVLLQGPLGCCVITNEFDEAALGTTLERYCSN